MNIGFNGIKGGNRMAIYAYALGRLGKDAEMKMTKDGKAMISFSVATDRGTGESRQTDWINCSWYSQSAEKILPFMTKGRQVLVQGEISNRIWTDKSGANQSSLDMRVSRLDLAGEKKEGEHDVAMEGDK